MIAAPSAVVVRRENALCGDSIELAVEMDEGAISSVRHRARACSLVGLSAALLAEHAAGRTAEETRALAARLALSVRGAEPLPDGFESLAPVVRLPSRRRCALLPWEALNDALAQVESPSHA